MRTVISSSDLVSGRVANLIGASATVLQPQMLGAPSVAGAAVPQPQMLSTPLAPDNFTARLVKYVPADVIAVYVAIFAVLSTLADTSRPQWLDWGVFAIIVVLTPFYLLRVAKIQKASQIAISTGALLVWAFAYGKPFSDFSWYSAYGPVIAGILLPLYTFGISIIEA